jgi:hypothetical protein
MTYYFDLRRNGETVRDDEGMECADLAAVGEEARSSALEILTNAVRTGETASDYLLEVRDESGARALTFPFSVRVRMG